MSDAIKFPKTPRLAAVRGTEEEASWRVAAHAIVEEKVDGANVGVWFEGGELRLQSRGHVLRERHFSPFDNKAERQFSPFHGWAAERLDALRETLGERFVLYGEWCWAANKSYYDALPDWLLGLDVRDRGAGVFLATERRDRVFEACRVVPVARLWEGEYRRAPAFGSLIERSRYKTPRWQEVFRTEAAQRGNIHFVEQAWLETDQTDQMEGVYVRLEIAGLVVGRIKVHRPGYEKVRNDTWRERPILRNRLRAPA